MLKMDPSNAKTAQEKAKVKKDEVVSRKQYVTKLQKSTEGRYKRLRRKYNHSKNKAKRLLKHLSFVPWLRDFGWA
jgi:5-bromo-4-chloroindolyl phosphate hydrolysis protein